MFSGIPWILCIQEYLESCASRYTFNTVYPGIPLTLCIQVYFEYCVSRYTSNTVYPGIPWIMCIQVFLEPCESRYNLNLVHPELETLEWINFNPDFLIRISTVETFHFCSNPIFFFLLGYPLFVFPMRIFLFSHWIPAFLWLAATVSQMIKY